MGLLGRSRINRALISHGFRMRDEHADGAHDEYEDDADTGFPYGPQLLCYECIAEDDLARSMLGVRRSFPSRSPEEASAYLLGWFLEQTRAGLTKNSVDFVESTHRQPSKRRNDTSIEFAIGGVLLSML